MAVCLCGLNEEYPFCDGSHRRTEDEDLDATYKYVDGERRVVVAVEYADSEGGDAGDDPEASEPEKGD